MRTVLRFSVLDIFLKNFCNKEVLSKMICSSSTKLKRGPNNGNDNEEGKQLLIFDIACSFDIWSR